MSLLHSMKTDALDAHPHHAGGSINWNSISEGQFGSVLQNNLCNLHSIDPKLLFKEFILEEWPEMHLEYLFLVAFFMISKNEITYIF